MSGDVALRIDVLPASFGDCLLVTVPDVFTLVVDTGPGSSPVGRLRKRLAALPQRDGRCVVDLFVVTHIDADHIAGATRLLEDDGVVFRDIWFNGLDQVPTRGTAQADAVSAVIKKRGLPLNCAFDGGPVVVPPDGEPWHAVDLGEGLPRITLLSPGAAQLDALALQWPETVRRLAAGEPDSPSADVVRGGSRLERPPIDLDLLAATPYAEDDSVPNASSIALLVEHRGRSLLLTGDAVSSVYGGALAALMAGRGAALRPLDVVKLAHHGSRRNTEGRLALLGAEHYLVSSNNKRYGLPDDETLARLVQHRRRPPTFWFNYTTPLNRRWEAVAAEHGGFSVRLPQDDDGIVLELPPLPGQ